MFEESFKGVSRSFQRNSKVVSRKVIDDSRELSGYLKKFKWYFKGFSMQFQKVWKEVSRNFKENGKCVSRKFQCFNEVLLSNFLLTWISSQLPEQKEGLLNKLWANHEKIFKKLWTNFEQCMNKSWMIHEKWKIGREQVLNMSSHEQIVNKYLTNIEQVLNK